jgi:CheY-like chemotaxis protein
MKFRRSIALERKTLPRSRLECDIDFYRFGITYLRQTLISEPVDITIFPCTVEGSFLYVSNMTTKRIRIVIVEDHAHFREFLAHLLAIQTDIEIVGEAVDGPDAIRVVDETVPDVVCMDFNLPGFNGTEATRRIISAWPNIKVISLSAKNEQGFISEMLDAGAVAYVWKMNAGTDLVKTIRGSTICVVDKGDTSQASQNRRT